MGYSLEDLKSNKYWIETTCDGFDLNDGSICGKLSIIRKSRLILRLSKGQTTFFCSNRCRTKCAKKLKAATPERKKLKEINKVKRFWNRIIKGSDENDCWQWTGQLNYGYGYFPVNGTPYRAHIFSYELHKGKIEKGLIVRHLCPKGENRQCCNPLHLELGTNQDSSNDMIRYNTQARGSSVHNATINEEIAGKIKYMFHKLGWRQCEIINHFNKNYSKSVVHSVCKDISWTHVPIPEYINI